jgi:hypothetical protein
MKFSKLISAVVLTLFVFTACEKELSSENGGTSTATAVGTLKDSLGGCKPATIAGSYIMDTALKSTNFVEIQVAVTTGGYYKIYTDTVNGMYFVDSGFFASTGDKTIRLKGYGKPILPFTTSFTVSFGTDFCFFDINVSGTAGGGGGGTGGGGGGTTNPNISDSAWSFTEGTNTYNGPIDTAFVTSILGFNTLVIGGTTANPGDSILSLGVILPSSTVQTGTYSTTTASAFFDLSDDLGTVVYEADNTVAMTNFTIIITSYNPTTKIVEGTFSGTARKVNGNTIVNITSGKFKARM